MSTPLFPIKPRFSSEKEILESIDRTVSKIARLRKSAGRMDEITDLMVRKGTVDGEKIKNRRETADRRRNKAQRIESGWLVRLKNDLSVFRTELLPNVINDRSIPQ